MTTDSPRARRVTRRRTGGGVLVGAVGGSALVGGVLTAVAGLADGAPAAYGALVGSALAVAVLAFGSSTVHVVAGLMPSASLAVALLTYTLQLLVVLVVLVGLERSAAAQRALAEGWVTAGLVGTVLAWVVAQTALAARARIPIYDLPVPAGSAAPDARTGGER